MSWTDTDAKRLLLPHIRMVPGVCLFSCPLCKDEVVVNIPLDVIIKATPNGGATLEYEVMHHNATDGTLLDHIRRRHPDLIGGA